MEKEGIVERNESCVMSDLRLYANTLPLYPSAII